MENKSRDIPSPARTAFGPLKEAKNLRVNGSASVAELKEFLASLKGRNPQEVIGMMSASMLIQSLGIATVATALFLAVFTIGPYFAYGPPKKKDLAAKTGATAKENKEAPAAKNADDTATDTAKSDTPDASKAAKALGIDEVKNADPTKNPLDKGPNIDNLLDGLDK
jgi:hypothetical protein